jgi:hypothetical protein
VIIVALSAIVVDGSRKITANARRRKADGDHEVTILEPGRRPQVVKVSKRQRFGAGVIRRAIESLETQRRDER